MPVNQKISKLPPSPSFSKRPESFDSDGENWSEAIDPMTEELNTMADEINATQGEINTSEANALAYRNKAEKWSEENQGIEVEPGKYSAKHHSLVSKEREDKARLWAESAKYAEVEPGEFSAKHYSLVVRDFVTGLWENPIFSSSVTSLAVSLGAKSLITDTGKNYAPDMWVLLISKSDTSVSIRGYVTTYNSGTGALDIVATSISGTGSASDWLISQIDPSSQISSGGGISAASLFIAQSM